MFKLFGRQTLFVDLFQQVINKLFRRRQYIEIALRRFSPPIQEKIRRQEKTPLSIVIRTDIRLDEDTFVSVKMKHDIVKSYDFMLEHRNDFGIRVLHLPNNALKIRYSATGNDNVDIATDILGIAFRPPNQCIRNVMAIHQ